MLTSRWTWRGATGAAPGERSRLTYSRQAANVQPPASPRPLATRPRLRLGCALASAVLLLVSVATVETPGASVHCALAWAAGLPLAIAAAWPYGQRAYRVSDWPGRVWRAPRGREAAAVAALTLVGAALRFYDLAGYPTGINGDEAELTLVALDVLQGRGPNPFGTVFGGDSALYLFFQAPFLAVFGATVAGMRVFGALSGLLTLPAFYLLLRRLFGPRPALLGLALLAGNAAHVHFSRLALNVPQVPLLACLAMYALWRATENRLALWWLASGMLGAFAVYFHFGGRLLPVIVGLYFAYLLAAHRREWRAWLRGAALCLLGGGLALAPMGAYAAVHPQDFSYHVNARLIFNIWPQVTATYDTTSLPEILLKQFGLNLLGFISAPDGTNFFYTFARTPLLAPLLAPFFVVGLGLILWRWRDQRYGLLAVWFWTFILVGTITNEPPQAHRLVTVIPPAIAGVALALEALLVWARRLAWPALVIGQVVSTQAADQTSPPAPPRVGEGSLGGRSPFPRRGGGQGVRFVPSAASPPRKPQTHRGLPGQALFGPTLGRLLVGLALALPLAAGVADNANYFGPAAAARPWEEANLQATYVAALPPTYRVYVLGAPYMYYNHGIRRFLAPDVPGGDLQAPSVAELESLPRDGDLAFLVYPWAGESLPLIQRALPGGRVDAVAGGQGRTVFTVYLLPRR